MPITMLPTTVAVVNVKDLGQALAWYEKNLGFASQYALPEMGWAEIETNVAGLTLGLNVPDEAGGQGASLTFSVPDIEAARAFLESNGVTFAGPTREIEGMVRLASFFDPDGNELSLAQTLQPEE